MRCYIYKRINLQYLTPIRRNIFIIFILIGRKVFKKLLGLWQKEFMACDIRRELANKLQIGLNFQIPYNLRDHHNPIDYLMTFLQQNDIFTNEQLKEYKEIEVAENQDGVISFFTEKATDEKIYRMDVFSSCSFWDLLGWTDLASYFDPKSHKHCRTRYNGKEEIIEYFDSWTPTNHSTTELSYRKIKRPIDSYERAPHHDISLREEFIIEDNI